MVGVACEFPRLCPRAMIKPFPQDDRSKSKIMVALLLTFAAGIVDIVGYMNVYHLFVAHMTGTTVHMGNQLVTRRWTDAAIAAIILLTFVAGSIIGRCVIELGSRRRIQSTATVTLMLEAALLLIFVRIAHMPGGPLPSQPRPALKISLPLGLLAAAMGIQTATLTRIGPLTIHTTFVTGMLNKFAEAASQWLFWVRDEWRNGSDLRDILRRSNGHSAILDAQLMLAIWFSYTSGSVVGTLANSHWKVDALYMPGVALLLAALVDQFRPLSIEEEKEQLQR